MCARLGPIIDLHCNPELLHAVSQLSEPPPIFHIWIPAIAHALSVASSILLVSPLSQGGKTDIKEVYLPVPQSLQVLAPRVAEYMPVSQSLHATEPVVFLYLPAGHAVHADAGSPVNPTMHLLQSLMLCEFAADVEFPGQSRHDAVLKNS